MPKEIIQLITMPTLPLLNFENFKEAFSEDEVKKL
jgi:hypothetical protein